MGLFKSQLGGGGGVEWRWNFLSLLVVGGDARPPLIDGRLTHIG